MDKLLEKLSDIFNNKVGSGLLNEAIPLSEYRRWYQKFKDMEGHKGHGDYRKRFDSWFTPTKDSNGKVLGTKWRHYIPMGGAVTTSKSKNAPRDIASALEKEGWKIEDYTTGKAFKTSSDSKEIKSEEWDSKKQYPVGAFVKHNGVTWKAIKKPTTEPSATNKEWLNFDKVSKGAAKKVEKSIGSIFVDLAASAKKSGDLEKEKLFLGLERKNKKFQEVETPKNNTDAAEYVVISRHPYDVMGASADRGWYSCQNVGVGQSDYPTTKLRGTTKEWDKDKEYTSGSLVIYNDKVYQSQIRNNKVEPGKDNNYWSLFSGMKVETKKDKLTGKINKVAVRDFKKEDKMCVMTQKGAYYLGIGGDVRYGAMIAYIVDADDKNINNPKARMLIKPYVKPETGEVHLFSSPSQYGTATGSRIQQNKEFDRIVNDWLEEHQSGEGVYTIKHAETGSLSSGQSFEKATFGGHYPEESKEVTVNTSYKNNSKNVKEFKDGLTWEEIIDQHRWFAKNTFKDVVIGEDYGTLILYSGTITDGTWKDGDIHEGNLRGIKIIKGTIKNATINDCDIDTVKLDNCKISNSKFNYRNTLTNKCIVSSSDSTGNITAKDCSFIDVNFNPAPNENVVHLSFENCSLGGDTKISSKIAKENIKSKGMKYINFNQNGGYFPEGTVTSGTFTNVEIEKIIVNGLVRLNSCIINHGIINGGVLKNCVFKAGVFKKGRFFGGDFLGGTFSGGHFISGNFGPDAIWKGGIWHGGNGKPKNAKEDIEDDNKTIGKNAKEFNLKKRLEDKKR